MYLRTLDVRTLGIAGGSMVRAKNSKIIDVGPRSAHIAGLKYVSFSDENTLNNIFITNIQPKKDDPDDYIAFKSGEAGEPEYTLTPTEASNYLKLTTDAGYGKGNINSINKILDILSNIMEYYKRER